MTRQLAQQTILVVNILVKDDTGAVTVFLYITTKLFLLLWRISRLITAAKDELAMLFSDAKAAIGFTGVVLTICLSAVAFGLGMKL